MNNLRLRKRGKLLGVILLTIMFLTGCNKAIFYTPTSVQEEMDKAVKHGYDGMIVYVDKAGEASFYSAGYNNRENETPADPRSLFKIASISKLYLATAATKLIANDQLSLDAKLSDLLPEVKGKIKHADEITLAMMLKHRSGILDWSREPEVAGETFDDYMSFMARIYDKKAKFKPNKKYRYSNSNYLLLAEIMDRTLNYSHQDYIQTEILNPLALVNTYNVPSDADTNRIMSGYLVNWKPDVKSWNFPLPGGNMVATAEDVGTFLRALIDGTLLTEKEQAIYSSVYEYEHTGWLPGYCSIARYHRDMDAVIIQFVNTSKNGMFWVKLERVYDKVVRCVEKDRM